MVYAALVSAAQVLEQILYRDRDCVLLHHKQQIQSFREQLVLLQVFLEYFPEKANGFEKRIKDAANEAEDISEYFLLEQLQSSHISKSIHIDFQRLYQELQKVSKEIDSIVEGVEKIKNSLISQENMQLIDSSVASLSSRLAPTSKVTMGGGFEDNLTAIKARILGGSSELQVIPIVGMGGIGKTTLARNAYNDKSTLQHFRARAWVTVPRNYSVRDIYICFLQFMRVFNKELGMKSDEQIAEYVYKKLEDKRYLIVMDDVWSTKAWDDVKMVFPANNRGSRVMLTSRLWDVASYADPFSPLHVMDLMNADESWDLIRSRVFKQESCPCELEEIGKLIASSCRGLPLALVLIAGILSAVNRTQVSWENVSRKVELAVSTQDEQFRHILSLSYTQEEIFAPILSTSYTYLPHHLRPCFLYMGSITGYHEIYVPRLIKLWIAEGFLKPSGSKTFEEMSEEYLEDLVSRNLIVVQERSSDRKIKSCCVHDLVGDMCIRIAQEEKFLWLVEDNHFHRVLLERIKDQRRISFFSFEGEFTANVCSSSIRTILYFKLEERSLACIESFRLLRVLDSLEVVFVEFPVEVLELVFLRYLALSFNCHDTNDSYTLPEKILNLQKLQTLILNPIFSSEEGVVVFPVAIWGMPQLRDIVTRLCFLPSIPTTSPLENLQTLVTLRNFNFAMSFLEMVPNLKKLGISYTETQWSNYPIENLVHLHKLERLKFCVNYFFAGFQEWKLAFPMSLKKLTLSGRTVRWQDMGVVGSLPNLEVLKLVNREYFSPTTWKTKEGHFPSLKFLLIKKTDLQHWITESCHFPRLERLVLLDCPKIIEIPHVIGYIPTLQLIEVDGYNSSVVASAKRIREEQHSLGNDGFRLRIIYGPLIGFNTVYTELCL